jgi:site-specific DNA-methyltransferase (adenine-specific)
MKSCEMILYFWKGRAKTINNPSSNQIISIPSLKQQEHPTAKPSELFIHLIENSSNTGDLVLDPFLGSGACGVAAIRSRRKFIGIEIEPKYFDLACKNMRAELGRPSLFKIDEGLASKGGKAGEYEARCQN